MNDEDGADEQKKRSWDMVVRNLRKMSVEVIWCCLITPILGDAGEKQLRSL
jgi:hypothetical protein